AVVKLFPQPQRHDTAFIAVPSPQAAVDLMARAQTATGNRLVAVELMPRIGLDFLIRHIGGRDPLATPSPWYVLCEAADAPAGSAAISIRPSRRRQYSLQRQSAAGHGQGRLRRFVGADE